MVESGLNVPTLTAPGQPPKLVADLIDRLHELGVGHVRVPLQWRLLADDGVREFDPSRVTYIRETLGRLDSSIRVLAMLTKPPVEAVARYFRDQTAFAEQYAAYVTACARHFDRVDDWEIWNEPNASDFYMSVAVGEEGHRPWTAGEFLDAAVQPAAAVLRELRPDSKVCVGAVAENGIVGHEDRPPALSNLLPHIPRFAPLRSQSRHGHFYFVPGFAEDLISNIAALADQGEVTTLPDAVALHPYPYFDIGEEPYTAKSESLTDAFLEEASRLPEGIETWVTEVGLRSLDVRHMHRRDEAAQESFMNDYWEYAAAHGISRVYWYKAADRVRDLKMEKTFGVLDYRGNPRRAFFALRRLARQERTTHLAEDRFDYAERYPQDSYDRSMWEVTASRPYAFVEHIVDRGESSLLISPGRYAEDWWKLRFQQDIEFTGGMLEASFDLAFEGRFRRAAVEIGFTAGERREAIALTVDAKGRVSLGGDDSVSEQDVQGMSARISENGIELVLSAGPQTLRASRPFDAPWTPPLVGFDMRVDKHRNGVAFLRLHRFSLRRIAAA